MTYWPWIALGWAVCGFLAYGSTLAQDQLEYPLIAEKERARDVRFACLTGLFGPISLIVCLMCDRHGFMWRLPPRKDGT